MRHGRTGWNAGRRFQGHSDIPLDDEGRAQASALVALLARSRIDTAVASDLSRAVETARIVLGARTVPLRLDPDWREMQFGAWEGLTWEQITARDPALDPAAETTVTTYTPEGGETFDQLCARVRRAVERVVAVTPADGGALVATHAGPLHALLSVLLGEAERASLKVRFLTASITRFRRVGERWALVRLNETATAAR